MAGRPILALASLILLAGSLVLQFFVILSGAVSGSPLNKVYFLQAPSSGITGSGFSGIPRVAWTYFALCPITNDMTHNCRATRAAFPFDPQDNFGLQHHGQNQIPSAFVNTNYYYYMSRFAWAFYMIALAFAGFALITGVLALCSRIGGKLSGVLTFLAVVFQALAASLMTAWTVKGRDAFNSSLPGSPASLGKYAYGFSWGSFGALFIAMILFCISGKSDKSADTTATAEGDGSRKGFFSRTRNSRDGVKSEYS